ncbi:SDR family NAD(P)-dependent oxidoreductase [Patescibacteria group bacterium]|nr:SDR family NAD(P)-dependent oxidoreductase [Patescibacteria group bacterium]
MKTAIIFGHTSGLGLEVSKIFIEKNCSVIGLARSKSALQSDLLTNIQVDLSKEKDIDKTISTIKKEHCSFDYLIYCSGTLTVHNIDNINYSDMEYLYKVNVFAPMVIESALLNLVKENSADVVNITSSTLIDYYSVFSEYASSKSALQKFTQDLQKELGGTASRAIDFCPSGFASNIYKSMTGDKINRDETAQMQTADVAALLVSLLELPKKIEISHILVNCK